MWEIIFESVKPHNSMKSDMKVLNYLLTISDTCGQSFTQSGERNVHERTHTGMKPFTCENRSLVNWSLHGERHLDVDGFRGSGRNLPRLTTYNIVQWCQKQLKDDGVCYDYVN